jgi:outer membrane protein TolC
MKIHIKLMLLGVFATLQTGVANGMSLNDAIAKALAYDPTIDKIHSDTHEAEGFARELRADLLPQLSLQASAGAAQRDRSIDGVASGGDTLFSRRAGLVGRQLLWDGGYHSNLYKDAKHRLLAKEQLDKAQRELTAFSTVEAYLDVIRARKQVVLAKANLGIHETVMGLSKKRAEAAGNQADIELSSARYNLAVTLVKERQLAVMQAEATFIRWVGEKPGDLHMPKTPHVASESDIEPTRNWHYQAVLKQRDAAQLEKKALERKYYPRLYLEASAGRGEDVLGIKGKDNDLSAMVVASWDLFDGGRRKAEIAQAEADVMRQEAILRETVVILSQDISARWDDYRTISERIRIVREYSSQLDKTVGLYQEQFDLGTRPLLSLLDIQNEVSSSDIRLADEERDYAYLGYRLLFFGGRLIPETVGEAYLSSHYANAGGGGKGSVQVYGDQAAMNVNTSAPAPQKRKGILRNLFSR